MTVTTETNTVVYDGDDATLIFPYPFRVLQEEDLGVFINLLPIQPDDTTYPYTISGIDDNGGGNITFTLDPPPTGDGNVVIARSVPATQEIDYTPYDDFPAETHERGLDKLTMLIQQAEALAKTGTINIPVNEIPLSLNLTVPPIEFRKNQVLAFDEFGNVTVVAGPGGVVGTLVGVSPGTSDAIDSRTMLVVDNASFGARLPLIGVQPVNQVQSLIQLGLNGEIPNVVLGNTPNLVLAVAADDGQFQPGVDSSEMIAFSRQAGVGIPSVEVLAILTPNKANKLVQVDEFGLIPEELVAFVGLRNLGPYRGDNLCDKPGDNPGDCTGPDYRNPSQRFTGAVFDTGDFFAVTIFAGEEANDNRISLYVDDGAGSIVLQDTAVFANDGITYIDVIATLPTVPVGWYYQKDRFNLTTAELVSYDPAGNTYLLGINVQTALDQADVQLVANSALAAGALQTDGSNDMTGSLRVAKVNGHVILQTTDDTFVDIHVRDSVDVTRGRLRYDVAGSRYLLTLHDVAGAIINTFIFNQNGTLTLADVPPVAANAVRRDYVDSNLLTQPGTPLRDALEAGSNLNLTSTATGLYRYPSNITNAPNTQPGILTVVHDGTNGRVSHTAQTQNAIPKTFQRYSIDDGATWGAWLQLGTMTFDGTTLNITL